MLQAFKDFPSNLKNSKIAFANRAFKDIVEKFHFFIINDNFEKVNEAIQIIYHNIRDSRLIVIGQSSKLNKETNIQNYIVCFEQSLIILQQSTASIKFFQSILFNNPNLPVCFLCDTKILIRQMIEIRNPEIELNEIFIEEISRLKSSMRILKATTKIIMNMWSSVSSSMSCFLIKKSYLMRSKYRINQFIIDIESKYKNHSYSSLDVINEDDFVELREVGKGSSSSCVLHYNITSSKLFVIKKSCNNYIEADKLLQRETDNYLNVRHPFLPNFYGIVKNKKYNIIEFINGKTLKDIEENELNYNDRIIIIFELMIIFKYFHDNGYIYRDLKPNNVMIDDNKNIVLIDFDRLIKNDDDSEHTLDIYSNFNAPEVYQTGHFSYSSDIYSLGKMMEYLMSQTTKSDEISKIEEIYKKCLNDSPSNRPSFSEIIIEYNAIFQTKIQIECLFANFKEHFNNFELINETISLMHLNQNDPKAQFNLGVIYHLGKYVARDINKAIHYYSLASNQNHTDAQFNLGVIYHLGQYVTRDINKAIHFYSLASNQNHAEAQFNLGLIYHLGKYVTRDINKAIYYFLLASNQNHADAQFNLGVIYYLGQYVTRDINKAIHYFSLASNQNISEAQFILGLFYYLGQYVTRDINKAIHYFSLASNQNISEAQFNLGVIYHLGQYVTRDVNKAIHFYSLASNQNHTEAQFSLGDIYYKGEYVTRDIIKAIHYFSLASNKNHADAQFSLGGIYYKGEYVTRDINKAIHYFSLASNQNHADAQFSLGIIYHLGKYVARDINKAIHYYSLASNQNHARAQFNLGVIYHLGQYVKRDINKAIHYFSLASNQNHAIAQFCFGLIYYLGEFVTRDINKAIHYFLLASNQIVAIAQFNLGVIYYLGEYVTRDINKAIYYFSLASNQNIPQAQFNLGGIYYLGEYVTRDINKAIHYFSLASNQNQAIAQLCLGLIYYFEQYYQDIKKGIYYIMLASINGCREANFAHGFLLHKGKEVKRDMSAAIHYYKEASSFNNQYAKNNLGIIYRYGYDNVEGKTGNAIEYFKEAIRQKEDYLSMYNLAHIHIYDEKIQGDINKAIDLLIRSSSKFIHSTVLLSLVLVKIFSFNIDVIKREIRKIHGFTDILIYQICRNINEYEMLDRNKFEILYEIYKTEYFLYDIELKAISASYFEKMREEKTNPKYPNAKDITNMFYEGFELNI